MKQIPRGFTEANLLSWIQSTSSWQKNIKQSEICRPAKQVDVFFPMGMAMREGKFLCEKYWGNMTVVRNQDISEPLLSQIAPLPIWTGFSDEDKEGHFVDVIKGSDLANYSLFVQGEPNGDINENCVVVSRLGWYDVPCEGHYTYFCTLLRNPKFQIRGEYILDCALTH